MKKHIKILEQFFGIFFFFLFFAPICSFSDGDLQYLDYWKKIIEGGTIDQSNGKDWNFANKVRTFNEFYGKQILSFIRQGDYTHAGEEEALDLIMSSFPGDKNRKILDVACGLGGSADYFQKHNWGMVTGFDIEKEAVEYARQMYPQSNFFVADVANVSNVIHQSEFDIICIVNSFVCFSDQLQALKELRKLAKPTTKLVIFEYTDLTKTGVNPLSGNGGNISFYPIRPIEFETMLDQAGWKLSTYITLDEKFELWYKNFIVLIESKRSDIDQKFGENSTNYVRGKYDLIYYSLKNKWLGGCLMTISPKTEE